MIKKFLKCRLFMLIVATIARCYVSLLFCFCRQTVRIDDDALAILKQNKVCILCYWHSRILLFPKFMLPFGKFAALVSVHGDGEYLTTMLKAYGHKVVRGSSRKDNIKALMGVIKMIKSGVSVAITPDGPRGPRFKIKGAIGELALRYQVPVIPISYSASNAFVLKTWDKFILPIPFKSRLIIEIGKPINLASKEGKASNDVIEEVMLGQTKKLDQEVNLNVEYE